MKKEKNVHIIIAQISILVIIGVGTLIFLCINDSKTPQTFTYILCGLGLFFGSISLAIYLLIKNFEDLTMLEVNIKIKKQEANALSMIPNLSKRKVQEKIDNLKCDEIGHGFYLKKKFSFSKDRIAYYIRIVDSTVLEGTIRREAKMFDNIDRKVMNECFVLFIMKNEVTDEDLEELKGISINLFIDNDISVLDIDNSLLIVLVDTSKSMAYYFDTHKKFSISLYVHACKFVKKYFM